MTEEIHDMSRVNSFMASRRQAMFFHSVWKPMLAGAVGAAIMSAAVIGSVWVILPKISVREVTVDHVIQKDVPFDNHVPQDKPFDNYVPHAKPFDLPVPTPGPQASAATPLTPADAPQTPAEKKFSDRPDFAKADIRGRIIHSVDGTALSFDTGKNWYPTDKTKVADAEPFIGDLAYCNEKPAGSGKFFCFASHDGKVISVPQKPAPASASPTVGASNMVMVDVTVGSYPVEAMVDTGCSFPMAIPRAYADALMRVGLATHAGSTSSMLADGSTQAVDMVMIKSITVDGRTLHDVEASVSPSDTAPILLGLGALNRLGSYSIQEGRLVFTGEQPA